MTTLESPELTRARADHTDAFTTRLRVRYAETDAAGVVYYGNYLTYFEVARVELLRALDMPITQVEARGLLMPVVEAGVKYLRPARLDDLLDVSLRIRSVGPASFAFDYEIHRDDGLLLATGWTRMAVCEREQGRCVPMPSWLRELFARVPEVRGDGEGRDES
ncbi:MAG: thioesterase family protein [Thermoleophilia bacterium]